ncbi:MAG: DUF2769 domain-containing protein [Candidatus Hodarchaeota archaeon]
MSEPEDLWKCICSDCPTYPGGEKIAYCYHGKSSQTLSKQVCICDSCDIFHSKGLNGSFFCEQGKSDKF